MPPKNASKTAPTPASAKLASIPNRPKNTEKLAANSMTRISASGSGGGGGRPNKAAYDAEQEQLRRQIDQLQSKLTEVRVQIGDPKAGGVSSPLVTRRKALRDELDALREEQSKGKSSRGRILEQIRSGNETVQRKIQELNSSRGSLPYKSSAELDAKIRQLEAQIESGTMRIVEEKKALAEIQNLKKARRVVEALGPQQAQIEAEKDKVDALRKQLDDPQTKSASDRWAAIKAEIDSINEKLNTSGKSRDKLYEERNQIQDSLNELFTKKRESALRYKEANDRYYAKMQDDQQRRIDRENAQREAEEASKIEEVRLQMLEDASAPAFEREIEDCRTLILYFDKLLGNAPSVEETDGANQLNKNTGNGALPKLKELRQVTVDDAFQGMVAIKKKGAEEEEFFMGGGGKKGKKNKKQQTGEPNQQPNQPLHLPLSTINALHALALTVPMTREEVVGTIAALSEKKQWFAENQDRVTKERIAEAEANLAATQVTSNPVSTEKARGKPEATEPQPSTEMESSKVVASVA